MNRWKASPKREPWFRLVLFPALFTLAALAVQLKVGGFATDRGQTGDEAAHFVTSLMLTDYLKHLGHNPIAFAKDYYVHLPRVAIGHWPPFFELVQAMAFAVFGGNNLVAMALQALIAGLMAGLPAALMARNFGLLSGLLTGLIVLLSRYVLFQLDTVMADNLLGLMVFLTAWSWAWFYRVRSLPAAAAFAAAAACAILTKGTAIGLLLLPILHVGIKRDWGFLFHRWTMLAVTVIFLTVPWYAATYSMAASGWNYHWGWDFSSRSVPAFSAYLFRDFGLPCLIGFFYGAWRVFRGDDSRGLDLSAFAAAAIVQFLFILIVPADLQPRYLVPVFPCAAMVAVWGLYGLFDRVLPLAARSPVMTGALTALAVLLSIAQGFEAPHVESFHTREAFTQLETSQNPLLLVSGSSRFEGALIATVAVADRGQSFYALRASKLLSSSSFMGNGYKVRFASEGELKDYLVKNRIGWILTDTSPESMAYAHHTMLLKAMADDPLLFRPVWRKVRADGVTALYETPAAAFMPRDMHAVLAEQAPSGVP